MSTDDQATPVRGEKLYAALMSLPKADWKTVHKAAVTRTFILGRGNYPANVESFLRLWYPETLTSEE